MPGRVRAVRWPLPISAPLLFALLPRHRQPASGQSLLPAAARAPAASVARVLAQRCGPVRAVEWATRGRPSRRPRDAVTAEVLRAAAGASEAELRSRVEAAAPTPLLPLSRNRLLRFELDGLLRADAGDRRLLLEALNAHGIALVTGAGTSDAAAGTLAARLSGGIGAMRTLYGESFVVEVSPTPINVAYSDVALELHQDLAYLESPPGLQLLHYVRNDSSVSGGNSMFLDAFHAAGLFRSRHPRAFALLCRVPAAFAKVHYQRAVPAHFLRHAPHFTVACPFAGTEPVLTSVCWSPPFESAADLLCAREELPAYFAARSAFAEVLLELEQSSAFLEFRPVAGELIVFNQRRMLHGRREIRLGQSPEPGARRLVGAYVNADEWLSHLRVLRAHARVPLARDAARLSRTGSGALL